MTKRAARAIVLAATLTLAATATACGGPYDNPPATPIPPEFNASAERVAAYEFLYAAYQEEYREYQDYWHSHEQGYASGRNRTCSAIEQTLAGSSPGEAWDKLDSYEDELPEETVREQGYAKGFAEGRKFVNDAFDKHDVAIFEMELVCR